MNLPLVSVIIPHYNNLELLKNAIKSVEDQDYPNKQIVIVDDASENQAEILPVIDALLANANVTNAYLVPLTNNKGRSGARNAGIAKVISHTHIFSFLDCDDEYLDGKISKSVAKIIENPEIIGLVYSDFITHNLTNNTIQIECKPPFSLSHIRQDAIINNDSVVSTLALKSCQVGEDQYYDESMQVAEDWDLWLRITSKFLAIHLAEPLLKVNITDKGATSSVNNFVWQENFQKIAYRLQSGYYDQ